MRVQAIRSISCHKILNYLIQHIQIHLQQVLSGLLADVAQAFQFGSNTLSLLMALQNQAPAQRTCQARASYHQSIINDKKRCINKLLRADKQPERGSHCLVIMSDLSICSWFSTQYIYVCVYMLMVLYGF